MRGLILFIGLMVAGLSSFAQTDVRANRVIADNALFPPYLDTMMTPTRVGQLTCRPADTSIYMAISLTASKKWMKLIKLSDLLSILNGYVQSTRVVGSGLWLTGGGNLITDRTLIVDTSAAAAYLLRRKDSLTSTNLLGYVTRTVLADTAAAIRALITGGGYTDENAQDAVGNILNATEFVYDDAGNAISIGAIAMSKITGLVAALAAKQAQLNGTGFVKASGTTISYDNSTYLTGNQTIILSGDVSGTGATSITTAIGANKVTLGMMAQVATARFLGRITAGTGDVEALTMAQAKTLLDLTGTNSGDQTITLTSDVIGSGTGSFATTIANDAVTLAKMANMATASFLGRNTASTGDPEVLSIATVKTMLNLTGTNSGDQTTAGTTNRITVANGSTNPVVDISATFEALLGKVANPLSQFAATTSAQLAGVISDEVGTDKLVFNTSPLFVTPRLAATSTIGYIWTATDGSGNGSFQAPGAASSVVLNGIANATATGASSHGNYQQTWSWPTISSGAGMIFTSSSTAASGGSQNLVSIVLSGINSSSGEETYALTVYNTHGGTGAVNNAGYFSASGGATNIAVRIAAGSLDFNGSSSGQAKIIAQAAAGTPTLTLPTTTGTFAVSATTPLSLSATTGVLTIADAVSNGSTKGAASFTAVDFNDATGNISIDWTNTQPANGSQPGKLTAADWTTFNGKQAALSGTGILSFSGTTPAYNTTSSSIAAILSDETGSGAAMFGTSPTITTSLIFADAANVVINTTTGTKFGTSTSQKISFFNATPIVQPSGNIFTALINLGLVASPSLSAGNIPDLSGIYQPLDADLTTISGLTATTDNFMQSKSGAWASRTIAQVKFDLGLTGTNSGDQTTSGTTNRITVANGSTNPVIDISATFEALLGKVANPLSQFAATTSAQLAGVLTNETGAGVSVFNGNPTFDGLTLTDGYNITLNTTTGTKIGTGPTQKIGFFNATPIIQPSGNLITALSNLGLVASGSIAAGDIPNIAGDVTGAYNATVVGKINGVALSGLATGILRNTTGTGVPSIAVDGTHILTPTTGWSTWTNAGLVHNSNNFFGTATNVAVLFRINGQPWGGWFPSGGLNIGLNSAGGTSVGTNAGANDVSTNQEGAYFGYGSGRYNIDGNKNVFLGLYGKTVHGSENSIVGAHGHESGNLGSTNTGNGYSNLRWNRNGNNHAAFGGMALYKNTTVISGVTITGGTGYGGSPPTVEFSIPPASVIPGVPHVRATGTAIIDGSGNLTGVQMTEYGSGYGWETDYGLAAAAVTFTGGSGTGAAGTIILSSGDDNAAGGHFSLAYSEWGDNLAAWGKASGYGAGGNEASYFDDNSTFLGAYTSRHSSIARTTKLTNATAIGYNAKVSVSNGMVLGDPTVAIKVGIGLHNPAATLDIFTPETTGIGVKFIANSLTTGQGVYFASSSTAVPGNTATSALTYLDVTGVNAASNVGRYGQYIGVTATGTNSVNVGSYYNVGNATNNYAILVSNGRVGFGHLTPTARLHLGAGTTTAGTAPVKIDEGSRQTTPEDGTINYVSNNIEFVETSTVYILAKTLTATATLDFGSTGSGAVSDLTVTVTGAATGDAVAIGVPNGSVSATATFTAWVSAANTVTVRFSPKATEDPASGSYRISVLKY